MNKDIIKEDGGMGAVAVNSMGTSSSIPSTGGVDTYDPFLGSKKKLRNIIKRKTLQDLKK